MYFTTETSNATFRCEVEDKVVVICTKDKEGVIVQYFEAEDLRELASYLLKLAEGFDGKKMQIAQVLDAGTYEITL